MSTRSTTLGIRLMALLAVLGKFSIADDAFGKLFGAGNYNEAIKYADEKIPIGERDASIWAKLGIAHEGQEMIEKALACYMVAIRNDAKNYEAHLGAARINNNLNQHENGLDMAKKALAIKTTGEASWEYARACLALKSPETKAALEKVVETDKANAIANRELGNIYYKEKNFEKALPLLKNAYNSQTDGETAFKLATAYQKQQNSDSAAHYFKEATRDKNFKNSDEASLELSRIYYKQEKFSAASEEYGKLKVASLSADDLYKFGHSLSKAGASKDSISSVLEAAVAKYGSSVSREALLAREKVGKAKLEKKSYQDALDHFLVISKADPQGKIVQNQSFLIAEAYDGLGDRQKAIPMLEKVIASDKNNVEAYARLADLYTKEKLGDKAQQVYEKLLSLQPNNPKVYMSLGEYSYKTRKFEDALKYYQKSFTLEQNADAAQGMMNAAWELKKFDLAADAAESALHKDPSLKEPQVILAKIHLQNKNYTAAQQILEKLTKADKSDKEIWTQLATCYEQTKNSAKLAEADKIIMGLDKKNVVSRQRYAAFTLSSSDFKEALQTYKDLASLTPRDADVFKNLYTISLKLNNKDDAANYLERYLKLMPKDAAAHKDLGNLLFEKKNSAAALASYRAALAIDPAIKGFYKTYVELVMAQEPPSKPLPKGKKTLDEEIFEALNAAVTAGEADEKICTDLAEIHLKRKNYAAASDLYQKALQLNPKNTANLSALASCQAKAGKTEEAIISYEQVTTLNQSSVDELKVLGELYNKSGKKDQAISSYKKYLDKKSESAIANMVAEYEFEKKNYNEAVKYYQKVSGKQAKAPLYLLHYGTAAYQGNDLKKASQLFEELTTVNPKDPEPFKTLYEIALKEKNQQQATENLQKYCSLKPTDTPMLLVLANLYYDMKNTNGALETFKAVFKADPKAKGLYKRYLELLEKNGTAEEKILALNGAVDAGEADVGIYIQLGDLFKKAGNYAKAIPCYEKASQLDAKNTAVLSALAECQVKTESTAAAILTYEQAVAMNPNANHEYKILGDLYKKDKKNEAAIKNYKKYLEKNSDNSLAKEIGEYSFSQKNYTDAIKYLGMVSGAEAEKIEFLKMYADAHYLNKDEAKAYDIYRKLAEKETADADIFQKLYEIAGKLGTKENVLTYLSKYAALKPTDVQAQRTLGDKLYEKKDSSGALAAYKAVLKADPKAKGFYQKYTELLTGSGAKDEEIAAALLAGISAGEANVRMYRDLADIYSKQGNHLKAVEMYEKASQLDTKNVDLITALGEAQAKSGNNSAAIMTYEQAVAMNPQANREFRILGDLYKKDKKQESAIKNYKKYLEKNHENDLARQVGEFAYSQKNYAEVIKYLGMVEGSAAENPALLKMLADAYHNSKDDQKAYEILKKLNVKLPSDADIVKKLYEIAAKTGKDDEYLSYLKKYVGLKPTDVEALRTLGDKLYEKKDSSGALVAYRAVLKIDPKAKGFYKRYAELIMKLSTSDEELVAVLSAGIAAGEADNSMYQRLASIYSKQGNHAKAVEMYEKASQLDTKNVELISLLGEAQAKSGNTSAAIMTYEQAVAMNPQANREFKILGDLYKKDKKQDAAIKNYKKYLEKNSDNGLAREIGEFAYSTKNYADVIKYLGMVSGADAENPALLKMYADACYQSKDEAKAFDIYKKLAQKTTTDAEVFNKLYEIAGKLGVKEESLVYLKKYTALKPSDVEAQRTLGDILYDKKDNAGALAAYRAVIKTDPQAKGFYKKYAELVMNSDAKDEEVVAVLNAGISAGEADFNMYKRLASIYSKQGNHIKAVGLYEKASQLDPKNIEVISFLGESQAKSGNTSAAIMTYEQAVAMNPKANKEFKLLGDLYKKDKKTESAIKNYKKYLENNSDNELAREIGEFAYAQKNYGEAIKYLGMVSGAAAENPSLLKMYADAYRQVKDDAKAYEIFKKMAEKAPSNADVFKNLYEIAEKTGKSEEHLVYLKKYAALKPADVQAQRTLGDKLFEKKDNAGAMAAYRAVLKADPQATGFYKKYAELVMNSAAKDEEVAVALNAGIAVGEADFKMYERLASIYGKQGNHARAVEMYEKASQLDPKNMEILTLLAESQAKSGKINGAILTYEQAIAMNPQASKEYKTLGDLYKKDKKQESAIKNYKKYLEKNADSDLAKEVGEYAFQQKNYEEAIKYLSMVSGKDAYDPALLKKFGEACYQVKDYQKAHKVFKQLAERAPTDADVMISLYDIAGKIGSNDEALGYLKKYTALKPADVQKQKQLGDALYERKDNAGAVAAYSAVLKADPSAKGFFKKYAEIVMKSGKDQEIVTVLNAAIAAGEADAEMYVKLGSIYFNQGNFIKAVDMYDKASQLNPKDGSLLIKLAQSQAKSGALNAAVLTYEQAVAMNPNADEEYKALGDLYMQQKKTDAAIKSYKKYLEKSQSNDIARLVGEHALNNKNYNEAVKYLAMVTGADASDKNHLMKFAMACYQAKDEFRAYQLFKQLANITPQDPVVFEKLYEIAGRAGTKDEVLTYLKKYASLKPADAKAQITLGDMLLEKKDESGALSAYRAALKADSSAKGFYKKYAELVIKSGTDAEKVVAINGAIKQGDADARMYKVLADIYSSQNLLDKAIAMYDKAAQLDTKNPHLLTSLAECQLKKGAVNEAILTLEQAVAINPTANQEYRQLGDLYLKQNKTESALKYYKKYLDKNPADDQVALIVGQQAYKTKNYQDAVKFLGMVKGAESKKASFLAMYGDAAFEVKDYPRALIIYKDLALLTPKDAEIFKRLFEISTKTGASEDALNYLKKFTALKPADAEAQKDLGDALYERKDFAGAFAAYQRALTYNPKIKGFYKKYVELVLKYGKPQDKLPALQGAINAGEADVSIYSQLGEIYSGLKNYPKAIEMYEKASQLDPKNADVLSSLAECQVKKGDLKSAALTYEQALAMNPNAVNEYKQLGDLYMQQKKTDAAVSAYKKYIDKAPSDYAVAKLVARSYYAAKDFSNAYKYFSLVKNDDTPQFLIEYGLSAVNTKNTRVAIDVLEKVRGIKGSFASKDVAYKTLAEAYEANGNQNKAAEVLNEYVKIPGVKDPDASYKRAVVYETINAAEAVGMYKENLIAFPRDHRNYMKLGVYYSRQKGGEANAVKYLEKVTTLTDSLPKVWLELGSIYLRMKNDQSMINAYRKYLEVAPEDADAIGKIGEILLSRKMVDDAMVFLEVANAQKENDPKIMTLLARGYIMTKRRKEGADILEKVIRITKGKVDDDLRMVLVDVYIETSQFEKAADELRTLMTVKKEKEVMIKYARVLFELGKSNDALSLVQEVKSKDPENLEAMMMIGKIKTGQKKYDDAIETYKEILYIDQNYAPALCERANVYFLQGKYQWAQTFYDRALKSDPKNAMVHLGLARLSKQQKDYAGYSDHLEKARKLDPQNREIQEELRSVRR